MKESNMGDLSVSMIDKGIHLKNLATRVMRRLRTLNRAYFTDVLPAVLMIRLSRFELIRNLYSAVFCRPSSRLLSPALGTPPESRKKLIESSAGPEEICLALAKRSHYVGLTLRQEAVDEVLSFAYSHYCYGNNETDKGFLFRDRVKAFDRAGKPFTIATYFNASERCGVLRGLRFDPLVLDIVARFLGKKAKFVGAHLVWSFPTQANTTEQNTFSQLFHFDTDDWRFLKFFWYLTDVDESSGPHVLIAGSHQGKLLRHQWEAGRYTDEVIENAYGVSNKVVLTGPAGLGFVEDTTTYHKGQHPDRHDRLMFVMQFAVNDWGTQSDLRPDKLLKRLV